MTERHWRQVVSKDDPNLHYWDIMGRSPLPVTVKAVGTGSVRDDQGEDKAAIAITFMSGAGIEKPYQLTCATNGTIIERIAGSGDPARWVGARFNLHVAELTSGPQKGTLCIRFAAPAGMKLPGRMPRYRYVDKQAATAPKPVDGAGELNGVL